MQTVLDSSAGESVLTIPNLSSRSDSLIVSYQDGGENRAIRRRSMNVAKHENVIFWIPLQLSLCLISSARKVFLFLCGCGKQGNMLTRSICYFFAFLSRNKKIMNFNKSCQVGSRCGR